MMNEEKTILLNKALGISGNVLKKLFVVGALTIGADALRRKTNESNKEVSEDLKQVGNLLKHAFTSSKSETEYDNEEI